MIFNVYSGQSTSVIVDSEDGAGQVTVQDVSHVVVSQDFPTTHFVHQPVIKNLAEEESCSSVAYVAEPGPQGPPGPPGVSGEEEMPYAERTDFVGEDVIYKGYAVPGTLDSEPLWRIKKLTIASDDDVITQWAGGSSDFVNIWANRASYTYV
jgi:hypothetical protein